MTDARSMDELRRYWDEIARGEPAALGDLDPDLAATIRRLHEGDDAPPDPAYARQLRETILQASTLPLPTPFPTQPNGRRLLADDSGASRPFRVPPRREVRPLWALLATAALIALTLAAGFAAIGGLVRNATRLEEPPGIPALIGTPMATPSPGDVLFDAILPAGALPPASTYQFLLEDVTVSAGQSAVVPPRANAPSLDIHLVLDGTEQVRPNSPAQVFRGGRATQAEAIPTGTTVSLAPGDAVVLRLENGWTVTNPGTTPLRLLDLVLNVGGPAPPVLHWNSGDYQFAAPRPLGPLGAVDVQVQRVNLGPQETLPAPALGVSRAIIHLDPRQSVLQSTDGSVRNPGTAPVTLYILTTRPAPSRATPTVGISVGAAIATPGANVPPGVTNDRVIVQQRVDQIPADAIWATLARTTLQPGASMIQGLPQHHGVGPMVYRIDAGSVTGQADGPIAVTRAGATAPTQVAANTAIVLATGDIAFAPSGVGVQWRNAGSAPATVLESGVAIPPSTGFDTRMNHGTAVPGWTAGDVSFEDLIDDYTTFVPPAAPAQLTVTQVTIAPGASRPGEPQPGLKLVSVETGALTVVWAKPTAPDVSTGTRDFVAGSWMDVNTTTAFAAQLRNDGAKPLVLLVMTLTPVGTETATPAA